MNKKLVKIYKEQLEHFEYYNRMSPFPLYDTEFVLEVKKRIEFMESRKDINYDDMPVTACKYCKNLYLVDDDLENVICMRCGSVNDVKVFKDIDTYLKSKDE